ncbi:hypothetical protein ALQ20_101809 [Pseudomonas syringae pv. atrofaciens]|uniref:Uncharacterized protein n=2 Tax=Pseudomonas syringae group TaxID=136849 RepID=A0A3M4XYF2_9PSED|nr:hypothetical protein ALO39_101214 [Pseudomonas syringae pv. lapsa]RML37668.1 hypothetical protein ALQ96_101186 [Pseudomonas syringae pv. atrofaciens]RMR80859.1 hypothetical protein ALP78_101324 [Pseudomonas coronafaciens pv. striafaciens]RML21299.1 hypothetical protein ALQ99_101101 [Pseudomonas syringae pv. lapsa]RML28159.1 hypothetical protein ALQ98_100944 [Pseudomonas syringae pv. lapsa]
MRGRGLSGGIKSSSGARICRTGKQRYGMFRRMANRMF